MSRVSHRCGSRNFSHNRIYQNKKGPVVKSAHYMHINIDQTAIKNGLPKIRSQYHTKPKPKPMTNKKLWKTQNQSEQKTELNSKQKSLISHLDVSRF